MNSKEYYIGEYWHSLDVKMQVQAGVFLQSTRANIT
jgi:hypothetical protein